jgi:response regulator of citrate/malate metabolism
MQGCITPKLLVLLITQFFHMQAELERILEENQKKLDQAKAKQTDAEEEKPAPGNVHNLSTTLVGQDTLVNDDVFVLGK